MDGKRSSSDLPEELVAKIIAMMPFPSIFKARTLSKAWLARFTPIAPVDEEEGKRATRSLSKKGLLAALQKQVGAASFQEQVLERAVHWATFYPVRFARLDSRAYDLASRSWKNLPCLSFLPQSVGPDPAVVIEGALFFLFNFRSSKREKLYMANIFARTWKLLPSRPKARTSSPCYAHIVTTKSKQTYKLVVLSQGFMDFKILQTYDSKTNAWSSMYFIGHSYLPRSMVHLNGLLYWTESWTHLHVLHCQEGIIRHLPMSGHLTEAIYAEGYQRLVVCNSTLLLVVAEIKYPCELEYKVMQIDRGSGRVWEIARGPVLARAGSIYALFHAVGHGDCIYFGFTGLVLAYNIREDAWSYFDSSDSYPDSKSRLDVLPSANLCQAGVNLFMAV